MKLTFDSKVGPWFASLDEPISPCTSVGFTIGITPNAKMGFRDFAGYVTCYLARNELWVWKVRHESETDTRARACRSANDTDADDDLFDP